jgi:superfamily II DNA or RNA helicase
MPSKLTVFNDYSFLQTDNKRLNSFLYNALRHRQKGYFHSPAYKSRRWDGFINFYTLESGKFLTGLLPEVLVALEKTGEDYEFVDNRTDITFDHTKIDQHFLDQFTPTHWADGTPAEKVVLEDYQVELAEVAAKYRRGVVFAPTSAGKTLIMVCIIRMIKRGIPILILQNRRGLAQQNYKTLIQWGIPNVGCCWGGKVEPNFITVATVQSLEKIKNLIPKFKCLIVDEIHDMMSDQPKIIYKAMKSACVRIAMSATPFKYGGKDKVQKYMVKGFFGPELLIECVKGGKVTTSELQERGRLSKSKCTFFPVREPHLEYEVYQDAVTFGIAENQDFHQMVKKLATAQKGRTLILVERIAHGDALNSLIPGSIWVRGQDDDKTREEVIAKLSKGRGNTIAIATQGIFNTGINVFIHNLINAAGGQAEHTIIQRMGRGLRTTKDKSVLNYYDFIFHINEYLLKHSNKRVKILEDEGHEVELREFDIL